MKPTSLMELARGCKGGGVSGEVSSISIDVESSLGDCNCIKKHTHTYVCSYIQYVKQVIYIILCNYVHMYLNIMQTHLQWNRHDQVK